MDPSRIGTGCALIIGKRFSALYATTNTQCLGWQSEEANDLMCGYEGYDVNMTYWYKVETDRQWHRVHWYNHVSLCGARKEYGGTYTSTWPSTDSICKECELEWVIDEMSTVQ